MNTLPKSAPLVSLGLPDGDHWVRFHVDKESVSFEVAASADEMEQLVFSGRPTGFVQRWGGTARKIADDADSWLTHINDKHLR